SPAGTFCSVNPPEVSTAAAIEVPMIATVIVAPSVRTDAVPAPDATIPEIVAPDATAPAGNGLADPDGAAGALVPELLPQAMTKMVRTIAIDARRPMNSLRIPNLHCVTFTAVVAIDDERWPISAC